MATAATTVAATATTIEDFEGVLKIVRCMQSWRDHEEVQEKGTSCLPACLRACMGARGSTCRVLRPGPAADGGWSWQVYGR